MHKIVSHYYNIAGRGLSHVQGNIEKKIGEVWT